MGSQGSRPVTSHEPDRAAVGCLARSEAGKGGGGEIFRSNVLTQDKTFIPVENTK